MLHWNFKLGMYNTYYERVISLTPNDSSCESQLELVNFLISKGPNTIVNWKDTVSVFIHSESLNAIAFKSFENVLLQKTILTHIHANRTIMLLINFTFRTFI